jgi:hypothetical protein
MNNEMLKEKDGLNINGSPIDNKMAENTQNEAIEIDKYSILGIVSLIISGICVFMLIVSLISVPLKLMNGNSAFYIIVLVLGFMILSFIIALAGYLRDKGKLKYSVLSVLSSSILLCLYSIVLASIMIFSVF